MSTQSDERKDAGAAAAAAGAGGGEGAAKPKRKRRWWRWLRALAVVVLVLVVIARIVVVYATPGVVRKVARYYGFDCTYDRMELYLLAGDVGIWGVKLRPLEDAKPVVEAGYCRLNLSPVELLKRRLLVHRLEADGVDVAVERRADGHVPLLEKLTALAARVHGTAASAAQPQASGGIEDVDLTAPLKVEAFRLQRLRAHITDRAVTPAVDTRVELDVRVSDVGAESRPTTFVVEMISPPLLDSMRIEGQGTTKGRDFEAEANVMVLGVHPRPAGGYLSALGLRPVGSSLSARMRVAAKGTVVVATAATQPAVGGAVGGAAAGAAVGASAAQPVVLPPTVHGKVTVEDVAVTADGVEAVALGKLGIDAESVDGGRRQAVHVVVEGARASARRTEAGVVRVAGIEVGGGGESAGKPEVRTAKVSQVSQRALTLPSPGVPGEGESSAKSGSATSAPALTLPSPGVPGEGKRGAEVAGRRLNQPAETAAGTRPAGVSVVMAALPPIDVDVVVRDSGAEFVDEGARPVARLGVDVKEMSVKGISTAPAGGAEQALTIAGRVGVPGVVRELSIDGSGTMGRAGGETRAVVKVKGDGVKLEAVRPYLDAIGVVSELDEAAVSAKAVATVKVGRGGVIGPVGLEVTDVMLADKEKRVALARMDVRGVEVDTAGHGSIRVAAVEVSGPEVGVTVTADGQVRAAGFRTVAAAVGGKAKSATTVAAGGGVVTRPTTVAGLPRIEIGKVSWSGVKLRLRDETVTPAFETQITDAGVEASDLVVDPGAAPARGSGRLHAWLHAPDLAGDFEVTGAVVPRDSGVGLDVKVSGTGIQGERLAPYVRPLGVEPVMKDGSVALRAVVGVKDTADGSISGSVAVEGLKYADVGGELVGVDSLRVDDVTVKEGSLRVGAVEAARPRARVAREADGAVVAAGVRVPVETMRRWGETKSPSTRPTVVEVGRAKVTGAEIAVADRAVSPAVATVVTSDAEVKGLVLGREGAGPAEFAATLGVKGALDRLTAAGTVSAGPSAQAVACDVDIAGLREGPLAAYVPAGIKPRLTDGRVKMHVEAGMGANPAGGMRAELVARGLDYRDGEGTPLVGLTAARVAASRIDWEKRVLAFDEVSVAGLRANVVMRDGGVMRIAGVDFGGGAGAKPVVASAPSTQPAGGGAPVDRAAAVLAASGTPMPLITLEKLDVAADEVTLTDETRKGAAPVVVSGLVVKNHGRIELLGDDAVTHPPAEVEFAAGIGPVVRRVGGVARVTSSGSETGVVLDVSGEGVDGRGLTALVPELTDKVDGSGMTDGRFKTHVEASVRMSRRALLDLDVSKPFDAEVLVKGTEFRASADGPVLAGVDELNADGIRVNAGRGEVAVRTLDVTRPVGFVVLEPAGLKVMGWTVKLPAQTGGGGRAATTEKGQRPATVVLVPPSGAAAAAASATPTTGEVKVGTLTVSGLDFRFEDRTSDPPLIVPLNSMDLEVRGLTSRALVEDRPIRFSAAVGAGKVPILRRSKAGRAAAKGGGTERELFSQATATGMVSLYPKPKGWVKTSMSGLELAALRGPAGKFGVDLGGGVFDSGVDVRFADDGSLDTYSKFVVTDLSLSEGPDGPINRTLHLPAPMDVVIGAMEAPDGSITVPLKVAVKNGEVSGGQITSAAAGALGSVIATAVASAPVKVGADVVKVGANVVKVGENVASLGGILPIGGSKGGKATTGPVEAAPEVVTFAAGDVTVDAGGAAVLRKIAERMKRTDSLVVTLRHELSESDEAIATERANPPAGDAADLAAALRAHKLALLAERSGLASRARAELASRADAAAAETVGRLRATDRELEETEGRLDAVFELLRPGADRQAARRTRAACLALGEARIAAVRAALAAGGVARAGDRVQAGRPAGTAGEGVEQGRVTVVEATNKAR